MPITPFLRNEAFDPGTITLMSAVLERVCGELGFKLSDLSAEIIAEKIIQNVQRGVKSKTALYLATMADFKFGEHLSS